MWPDVTANVHTENDVIDTNVTALVFQEACCKYRLQTSNLYAAQVAQIDSDWQTLQRVP